MVKLDEVMEVLEARKRRAQYAGEKAEAARLGMVIATVKAEACILEAEFWKGMEKEYGQEA